MSANSKVTLDERLRRVYDRWFLSEPALHALLCSQELVPNEMMACAVRSGKGRIEYMPELLEPMDGETIEELLRAEAIRILLKHPYERQPANCPNDIMTIASNCVLTDSYEFSKIKLDTVEQHNLDGGQFYEYYARLLNQGKNNGVQDGRDETTTSSSEQNSGNLQHGTAEKSEQQRAEASSNATSSHKSLADQSEMWEEDEAQSHKINQIIQNVRQWGSLPGQLVETIIASTKARIDYRKVISGFRSSVISSKRSLTRMRPNRRTEFENMGSIYRFSTSILVAVDVSGSISDGELSDFYSVVNRFFRYGIEKIDTVQFDCVMGEVVPLKRALQEITVKGRGGTSFQMLIDYVSENRQYDGLVILTDGYAQHPTMPENCRTKVLWVCNSEDDYKANHEWMESIGRCCVIK